MINLKRQNKVVVVLPAYNAEKTLVETFESIPNNLKRDVILVDDCSSDNTVQIARQLGIQVIIHQTNMGYGGNQKTCYQAALKNNADVIVMLHPDKQYDARVVGIMAELITLGNCDIILGNRIRTRREALEGGMPRWRYYINRISTLFENTIFGQTLGDWHSGLRAYSRESLMSIPFMLNNNDFSFDQQLLMQAIYHRFRIDDIPIPVRYDEFSSSISFWKSTKYGSETLKFLLAYFLNRVGIRLDERFKVVDYENFSNTKK